MLLGYLSLSVFIFVSGKEINLFPQEGLNCFFFCNFVKIMFISFNCNFYLSIINQRARVRKVVRIWLMVYTECVFLLYEVLGITKSLLSVSIFSMMWWLDKPTSQLKSNEWNPRLRTNFLQSCNLDVVQLLHQFCVSQLIRQRQARKWV